MRVFVTLLFFFLFLKLSFCSLLKRKEWVDGSSWRGLVSWGGCLLLHRYFLHRSKEETDER